MSKFITELFTQHPNENNMSYVEHFLHSSNLSFIFLCGSCKACAHSLFPFCFETSSTDYVNDLNNILNKSM